MQHRNIFAGPYLDRASHLRQDPEWFAGALSDERSRAIPVWNARNLVIEGDAPRAAYLELSRIPAEQRNSNELILLGRVGDTNFFTYEIESIEPPALLAGSRFEDLRLVASVLSTEDAGLLGYARAIIAWRRRHRYCGTCGSITQPGRGGHVLVCTNAACRSEQFPRIDPAIIVLISDGERALLGRQASWPLGRYSTIAGFVEPGESLEDAVSREVFEETGIDIDRVEYHSSQPWPFPASLMLGFTAHAVTTEIHLRDNELEDAQWFTRADLASGKPLVPPNVSISFRLIEDWFNAGGGTALAGNSGKCALVAHALDGSLVTLGFVLAAALSAGFVDAIVGGGGLVQLPALLAAYPTAAPSVLLGTNKLGSICGTAAAVLRYMRVVRVPWRRLLPAAAVAFGAALLGASLVNAVSPALFRPLVPIMLAVVLLYVLWHKDLGAHHAPRMFSTRRACAALGCIGAIGLYDGFFGPGTGSFLMLLFIRVYGFDFLHASAAARTINVATNAGALLFFGIHGEINWGLGVALGVCNAVGSVLGAHTAIKHGSGFVRVAFIVIVIALIAKTGENAWALHR